METAKDEVRRILDALPDDATLEDISNTASTCVRRSMPDCATSLRAARCPKRRLSSEWHDGSGNNLVCLGQR